MNIDPTVLVSTIVGALIAAALFFVVAFLVFSGTDLLKIFSRSVAGVTPGFSWIAVKGYGSYVAAVVLAALAVFWPNSGLGDPLANIFSALGITLDPNFVKALTTILISLMAAAQADSGKMPSPIKKQD